MWKELSHASAIMTQTTDLTSTKPQLVSVGIKAEAFKTSCALKVPLQWFKAIQTKAIKNHKKHKLESNIRLKMLTSTHENALFPGNTPFSRNIVLLHGTPGHPLQEDRGGH